MKSCHLIALFALLGLQATHALAQDEATLLRAQRDAANPQRLIIEAGKLKLRSRSNETESEARTQPDSGVARPAARRQAAVVSPKTGPAAPGGRSTVLALVATAGAPAPEGSAAIDPAPDAAQAGADRVATAEEPASPASSALPDPKEAAAAPGAEAAPSTGQADPIELAINVPTSAPAPTQAREALQLADYVEPLLPDRLRRRLQGDGEVVLTFTVNTDGSVADVAVQSSSERALETVALDAVRQWRYRPIASAQAHAAQLVFRFRE